MLGKKSIYRKPVVILASLVLEADGYPIGAAGYTDAVGEGYINNVVIDEEYRGHGFGKQLMEAVLNDGRRKGISGIILKLRVLKKFNI